MPTPDFSDIDSGTRFADAIDKVNAWKDEFAAQGLVPTIVTANYAVPGGGGDTPRAVFVDASAGAVQITLPLTTTEGGNRRILVWKIDNSANAVSIIPTSPDVLGYYGITGAVLAKQNDHIHFFSPISGSWSPEHDYARRVTTYTADGNLGAKEGLVLVDTTSAAVTLTLPDAADGEPAVPGGVQEYIVKWIAGANACEVEPQTGEEIDSLGASTAFAFASVGDSHRFRSDGSQWWMV